MYSLFIRNSDLTRDPVFVLFFSLYAFIFLAVLGLHRCRGLFIAVHRLLKLWHTRGSRAHGFSSCRTRASLIAAYRLSYPTTCGILVLSEVQVAQSCPTLCKPLDYTVHGILQARILEWVAFPFSRGSSQPRDRTQVSHIAGRFFTSRATRAQEYWNG